MAWPLPMLWCPSDVIKTTKTYNEQSHYMGASQGPLLVALTNYKGVIGTTFDTNKAGHANWCQNNGVFPVADPARKRSTSNTVKDGATHTFMIGEQYFSRDRATCGGQGIPGLGMGFAWVHSVEASAFGTFAVNWKPKGQQADADGNTPDAPPDCTIPMFNGFRSRHTGGALFACCDSRVVFIADNINLALYQSMFTVNGGATEKALLLKNNITEQP